MVVSDSRAIFRLTAADLCIREFLQWRMEEQSSPRHWPDGLAHARRDIRWLLGRWRTTRPRRTRLVRATESRPSAPDTKPVQRRVGRRPPARSRRVRVRRRLALRRGLGEWPQGGLLRVPFRRWVRIPRRVPGGQAGGG